MSDISENIIVVGKTTGHIAAMSFGNIPLDAISIVKLPASPPEIISSHRVDNDLILELSSGESVVIHNFFITDGELRSEIVLEGDDGVLWWGQYDSAFTGFNFTELAALDELLLLTQAGTTIPGWLLLGMGVIGAGVAAASGSRSNDRDDTDTNMLTNVQVHPEGTDINGQGVPGMRIRVRDTEGSELVTVVVGDDGNFIVPLDPPLINGETIHIELINDAGNVVDTTPVIAPDITAPVAATEVQISAEGTVVTGQGEVGATVVIRDSTGTGITTGVVDSNGEFTVPLDPALINGEAIEVVLVDAAGNVSAPVAITAPVVDTSAPDAATGVVISPEGSGVSGSGEPGSTVIIRDENGEEIAGGEVDEDGNFTVALDPPLTNGEAVEVVLVDGSGNESAPVTGIAPIINVPGSEAPDVPTNLAINGTGDTLTGQGEAGTTVNVFDEKGTVIGSGTVADDGSFTVTLNPVQTNGETVSVTLTNSTGSTSASASVQALDTTPPDAPENLLVNATGTALSGTGEAGAAVTVRNAANQIVGTGTVQPDGSFTVPLTPAQQDGSMLSIVLTDSANNSSGAGWISSPDLIAPDAPLNLGINATGTILQGQGEVGTLVSVYNALDQEVGTGVVGADGTFSVTLSPAQGDSGVLRVTLTDASGNESLSGTVNAPDLIPPAAPDNLQVGADGLSLSGTGEAGVVVTVRNAANQIVGSGVVEDDGTFTVSLNPVQNDGGQLHVTLTDTAGNTSAAGTVIAPDLVAPDMPQDLQVDATGTSLSGSGESNASVQVLNAADQVVGSGIVQADGSFSIVLSPAQGDSGVLRVILTDAIGNSSAVGTVNAADLIPPEIPDNLQVNDSGNQMTGTGEIGADVIVRNTANQIVGTGTVQPDGSFMVTLDPVQNDGSALSVTLTDAAGNVSAAGTVNSPDLMVPDMPLDLLVNATGTALSGTGEAGTEVTVLNAANEIVGTGAVQPDGSFTVVLSPVQDDSGLLSVTLTDAASNTSVAGTVNAPDLIPPEIPANLQINADGSNLEGTGEAGVIVTVRNAGNHIVGTSTVQTDGSFSISLNPPQVDGGELRVILADASGNISAPGTIIAPDLIDIPAPVNLLVSPDGATLTGTGEAGASVTVWNADGQQVGTGQVETDGSFNITLNPPQIDGNTLEVVLSDGAGKYSAPGTVATPDLTPPAIPVGLQVNADGSELTGTGEAGAIIEVRNAANQVVGTGTVQPDGSFSVALSPVQGDSGLISVTLTDAAGNTSSPATVTAPDLIAPDVPENLSVNGVGTELTGEGEIGATVTVYNVLEEVVGTGSVGTDGQFSITLNPSQYNGGQLSVRLTDASGNISLPGTVTAPVVVDIEAFDNLATAKVDILPTVTQSNTDSASYTLLLGLLSGINLQLLSTDSINFNVSDGSIGDITLTLDTLLSLDLLGDYRIVVQVKNGDQWEAVTGSGQASFLSIDLLANNARGVVVEGLEAGEYRAFVAINALVGLGVATALHGSLTEADYAHPAGYQQENVSGNVLTDINAQNDQDVITTDTVVNSVNGTPVAVSGSTEIQGLYGKLLIDAGGNYTYTPDAGATAIGKSEQFSYNIIDTVTGRQSSASLYINIDSDQVELTWEAPGDDADLLLSAGNDSAVTSIEYRNVTKDGVSSQLTPFGTSGLGLKTGGSVSEFTIADNISSKVTVAVGTTANLASLSVLPTFTLTLKKFNSSNNQWEDVPGGTISSTSLLSLPVIGQGVSLTLPDNLEAGQYQLTAGVSTVALFNFNSIVLLTREDTHLDEYEVETNPGTSGNILADDELGSTFTRLFVKDSNDVYQEVSYDGITVTGSYGVLNIDKHGDYTYTPDASQHHTVDVTEVFEYQLRHPNGEIADAILSITIDVSGAGVITGFAAMVADTEHTVVDVSETTQEDFFALSALSFDFNNIGAKNFSTETEVFSELPVTLHDVLSIDQGEYLYLVSENKELLSDSENYNSVASSEGVSLYTAESTEEDPFNQGFVSMI